jgi:FkbM family methyltransferase
MGGILYPFILKQYALERGEYTFSALPGDTVIDCGGCYGDTTLYFANAVGSQGRVYCYEFDPENLKIYKYNMDINPTLSARTWLLENALWSISGQKMCVVGEGPDRRVVPLTSESADTDTTVTDTIDAAAERLNISDVNLIKMDIEGAELGALIGARRTILRDRPKLAICIYHRLDHFWKVPQFIDSLNCGYEFRIGHFTIHAEETVLFAEVPRYAKSLSESRQPIPT